ncbi:MAG TPA: four helix bundle protein [Bacteroidales bacterium]|nr:four helix bundle protein [Bacteroidales bacterium]
MPHPWKDLIVWQKAHLLVIEIYKLSHTFPDNEKFGLITQLRRSAMSVPSNIVEGKSKKTDKEFLSFLYNSRGSLEETRYHLLLAKDLGYNDEKQYNSVESLSTEVSFLLNSLITSISKS